MIVDPAAPPLVTPSIPDHTPALLPHTGFDTVGLAAWAATLLVLGGVVVRLTTIADDRRGHR